MKGEMDLKHTGFLGLIGSLRDDLKEMVRREVNLLKTEISEKTSHMGKQGGMIAAGGGVALIGGIFVLIGICFLIALGLQAAGLSVMMSLWIAFLGFGLIAGLGGFFLMKSAMEELKKTSMKPAETLATLKEIRHPDQLNVMPDAAKGDGLGKTQLAKIQAERKIEEVQAEAEALRERLKPKNLAKSCKTAAMANPFRSTAIAAATVGLGMLMRRRRQRRIQIAL